MKKLLCLAGFLLILNACGGGNPFGKSDTDPTGGTSDKQGAPPENPSRDPGSDQQAGSPGSEAQPGQPAAPAGPNFQVIRSQIFQPKCLRCHSGAGSGGVNLETYESVLRNLSSVQTAIVEGSMPPRGPIDQGLQDLLLKWIQLGTPQ